jgi:hypothetical protein
MNGVNSGSIIGYIRCLLIYNGIESQEYIYQVLKDKLYMKNEVII